MLPVNTTSTNGFDREGVGDAPVYLNYFDVPVGSVRNVSELMKFSQIVR